MKTRRNFIKTAALFAAGSILFPKFACSAGKPQVGLQIYTVRDAIEKDFKGTLQKVAEIGYTNIEAAGYNAADGTFYGLKPKEFQSFISGLGMNLISSHASFIPSQAQKVIDDAAEAGLKYLIFPYLAEYARRSISDYKRLAEIFNTYGELCNKAGIKFGYHNHDFEFSKLNDQIPYDVLLNETDPKLVCMELDIYWIEKAGFKTLDYFEKYPGRFEIWHVKDMDNTAEKDITEVGNGIIDFGKMFAQKEKAGLKYSFIEMDRCKNYSSIESVKICYDNFLVIK